jgi:biotin-dependent carboxylase-like uncharacterized protein
LSVEVLSPGLLTAVQDLGRHGFQAFGMPVAGALDPYSLMAGNLVVGNDPGAAGLEVTLTGPELFFRSERLICVTGGDLSPKINGGAVSPWEGVLLRKGDVLSFESAPSRGARCWLCVGGGFDTLPVMGSRSTYLRGSLGGHQGRRLEKGDVLRLGTPDILSYRGEGFVVPGELRRSIVEGSVLRVIPGPQKDFFTSGGVEAFYGSSYEIGPDSDRMGYRLQGKAIQHGKEADIISDAVPWGAVQVPGNGLPIIMMADGPPTGGYPKIAAVINADLGLLALMTPGDRLSFRRCGLGEASGASRALKKGLARIKALLAEYRSRPLPRRTQADKGALRLGIEGETFDIEWEIIGRRG